MVGQEPVLYARSVRDNIVYGLDSNNYTDRMVLEASSKANCHEFIMELPERYETGFSINILVYIVVFSLSYISCFFYLLTKNA